MQDDIEAGGDVEMRKLEGSGQGEDHGNIVIWRGFEGIGKRLLGVAGFTRSGGSQERARWNATR